GLLFDRASALGGNFGNDLTAEVVAGLDARLPAIAFDRERLPQS
ncbi:OmpH family outer membrane protein, partial [Escherichia coli]|nr:OmpH family outer membrane protein [Escherichia coli]